MAQSRNAIVPTRLVIFAAAGLAFPFYMAYNVDEKIVNFMAPETMAVSPMLPDLNHLFGFKKLKPAFVV